MLRDFLLGLSTDSGTLRRFLENRDQLLSEAGLSPAERDAITSGDVKKLRTLLYAELLSEVDPLLPDPTLDVPLEFDIYNVPTTPHCPVNQTASVDPSFWKFTEPQCLWDTKGLTIVGTGIRSSLQTTPEARARIERASKVLYLVADFVSGTWIQELNPTAESLQSFYERGKPRMEIYNDIVEAILSCLHETEDLCVVFYGHPGVFVYPARESIRRAHIQGIPARMLPGISAEANLFADLGIDPGIIGMQSYEATSFLINKYRPDTSAGLILWQIGVLGETCWNPPHQVKRESLQVLVDYLIDYYASDHEVVIYEASELPSGNSEIQRLRLSDISKTQVTGMSTLYIPPQAVPSPDPEMVEKLKIKW